MYRSLIVPSVVLIVVLALSACTTQSPPGDTLNGTAWLLQSMGESSTIDGTSITLAFTDGSLQGSAGCNSLGGSYQISAEGALNISETFMTEMFCMDPAGIMEQESLYLKLLGGVTGFQFEGANLWLELADGETLVFTPQ